MLRDINNYYTNIDLADPEKDILPADSSIAIKLLPYEIILSATGEKYNTVEQSFSRQRSGCRYR
ncbi:unnamed protein product [Clonostachys chloroleuca]|uniref:Uncharacterized protein n=1 Tax=Clonostachys chloroleuca TaxID=1926264 RepID=A0AA35Q4P7_9HYPO|nr:unnamed protein product [Clonostachys chloroleuca]